MNRIEVMPVLIEVEKLNKKELVEKCKEQQETMILQDQALQNSCDKLGNMCRNAYDLGAQLWELADSFDQDDQAAIELQLQKISDQRKSVLAQKAKVN